MLQLVDRTMTEPGAGDVWVRIVVSGLRATRRYVARDYSNTDYQFVWNTLVTDFPLLLARLGRAVGVFSNI